MILFQVFEKINTSLMNKDIQFHLTHSVGRCVSEIDGPTEVEDSDSENRTVAGEEKQGQKVNHWREKLRTCGREIKAADLSHYFSR